jgi:hypothetical protein
MKYKIIHLFVKLTNLFQSKILTMKVNKIIIFSFFIIAVIAMATKDFTRFHWIIHDHVIHELHNIVRTNCIPYPTSTRRHGNFAGVHKLLRIILSSNSAVLINITTGVSPPHFDFFVFYVLCQC